MTNAERIAEFINGNRVDMGKGGVRNLTRATTLATKLGYENARREKDPLRRPKGGPTGKQLAQGICIRWRILHESVLRNAYRAGWEQCWLDGKFGTIRLGTLTS